MKKQIQEYLNYLTPKFIYIPFDNASKLKLKRNKLVYNNMFLGTKEDGFNIYSPVSGKILGVKQMDTFNGLFKCLVIENDFIDKREKLNPNKSKTSLLKMKKTDINSLLEKFNLNKKLSSKKNILIESTYKKDNDLSDMVINYEYYEEILETIDILMLTYNIKNAYICIPEDDMYSRFAYSKYINSFDNICIVSNMKKIKKDDLINITIKEINSIYKAIHKEHFNDTTIITITNNKPIIIKTKLYTHLTEILKDFKILYKGKNIYINNKLIDKVDNFIVTNEIKTILIK